MNLTMCADMWLDCPAPANSGARNLTLKSRAQSAHSIGAFFMPVYGGPLIGTFGWSHLGAIVRSCFRSATPNLTGLVDLNLAEEFTMNSIIPIASRLIAGKPTKVVHARKLHTFLEVGRDYSNWIKGRINQYQFEPGIDYLVIRQKRRIGYGRGKIEHFVTLDMAKELGMIERNDKGRQIRRYFIECEKKLKGETPPERLSVIPGDQKTILVSPLDVHNINAVCTHMRAVNKWWRKYGPAIRALNSTLAFRINDHFQDGDIFACQLERELGPKQIEIKQKEVQG